MQRRTKRKCSFCQSGICNLKWHIFSCAMLIPPPHTSCHLFICLLLSLALLGCSKGSGKANGDWKVGGTVERGRDRRTTGINQNGVSDSIGLDPGLLCTIEWLRDLGHYTCPLWYALNMRELGEVSSTHHPRNMILHNEGGGERQALG